MASAQIKLWVEALESGKYKQTTGQLKRGGIDNSKFCCLGVACDIYKQKRKRGRWDNGWFKLPKRSNNVYALQSSTSIGSSLIDVRNWLGINAHNEEVYIDMNDQEKSFKQIAKRIRKDHPTAFAD